MKTTQKRKSCKALSILMVLQTPGVARRCSTATPSPRGWSRSPQVSLQLNMGTLYPALMRLEQRGIVRGAWGTTDTNRKARFYALDSRRPPPSRERKSERGTSMVGIIDRLLVHESDLTAAGVATCASFANGCQRLWGTMAVLDAAG